MGSRLVEAPAPKVHTSTSRTRQQKFDAVNTEHPNEARDLEVIMDYVLREPTTEPTTKEKP